MTALYDPVIVTAFQLVCAVGAVVCGVLALRERGHGDTGSGRPPLSPWLVYCMGFLVGCMLSQLAKHAQQPTTAIETIAAHTSVVALLFLLWGICNAYARLWNQSERGQDLPQQAG
ncbi:MAG: hypothetical protein ACYTFN_12630 [Planctomycetota bacterium]|jgi:ABC-type branched-subunit amino acid transport system permease subunit